MTPPRPLRPGQLRLIVVTDAGLAAPRSIVDTIRLAVASGAPAVQLRAKGVSARELAALGRELKNITRPAGTLLFVNDRFDVALAIEADGVHLGPEDVPVHAARRAVSSRLLIGASTDDPETARELVRAGADYLGCGTVYPTTTKRDAGAVIGVAGLEKVVTAVPVPVVGIGGIDVERAKEVAERTGAAGVAVVGAVMASRDPGTVVEAILGAWPSPD